MNALLIAALAISSPDYDLSYKGGLSCSGGTCTLPDSNFALTCSECLIYQNAETTDAAAHRMSIRAGDAYPLASVNTSGGYTCAMGGIGSRSISIDNNANCAGDYIRFAINGINNDLTAGVDWTVGATEADSCTSLCSAADALVGLSCDACVGAIAPIVVDPGCYAVVLSDGDATCSTSTNGTDGPTYLSAATYVGRGPGVLLDGYTYDSILYVRSRSGGNATIYANSLQGANINTATGGVFRFGTRGYFTALADGGYTFGTYPSTAAFTLDATTADVVGIMDNAGTAGATIQMVEISTPAAPAANGARIYAKDNGAGKTQLCARFNTGAEQCFATEP